MDAEALRPKYLLMVDDDIDMGLLIRKRTDEAGYQLACETTSAGFLKALKNPKPDLCIIDMNLESTGAGLDLIESVRRAYGDSVPVLVMSVEADSKVIAHAIELGANDYIIKPATKKQFMEKCAELMSNDEHSAQEYLFPIPEHFRQARLRFQMELQAIEETGIKVLSNALIRKETVLQISSPLFKEIKGDALSIMVTAVANWVLPGSSKFGAFLEFDSTNPQLLSAVKRWLVNRKS